MNYLIEKLIWLLARKQLSELERWRVQWHEHRRWFAEFPVAAVALDHLMAKVEGEPVSNISVVRDSCRSPVINDPMDWPLPCDVTVGHGTIRKGVKLRTLVMRMKSLYALATGENADTVAARSLDERKAMGLLIPPAAPLNVLAEHSGCGHGTQIEQLTVRLNPGDKVVLVMGPYSAAVARSESPD